VGTPSPPEAPLTGGRDGGSVHAREERGRQAGWFDVIVGTSPPDEGASQGVGCGHPSDTRPKRRLFAGLKSQGRQANQQGTCLSDGGDTVRELQLYVHPAAEPRWAWFHLAMRVTVMGPMVKGLAPRGGTQAGSDVETQRERGTWSRWHGHVLRALQGLEELAMALDDSEPVTEGLKKLWKAGHELPGSIAVPKAFIPNDGDRDRHGETSSTAVAESTAQQGVSRRRVQQQPMRWTARGAPPVLQGRRQTFNDDRRATWGRWPPGMQTGRHQDQEAA
jgi:hypothetical protein